MGKNYLQLEIDGQVYGLKFNIGTMQIVGELTGQDPFKYKADSEDFADVLKWVKPIFHAALLTNHKAKKEDASYTAEQITELVTALSLSDINLINQLWSNPADSKPSMNGEVSANTQQGTNLGGTT